MKDPAAVALGRKGGKVKSEAKAAAARKNGKRPKRKNLEKTMKVAVIVSLMLLTGCASPINPSNTNTSQTIALIVLAIDEEANPLADVIVTVFNDRYSIASGATAAYFGSTTLWVPTHTRLRVILSRHGYVTRIEHLFLTLHETATLPRRLHRQT